MFTINEVAAAAGMPAQTLRNWVSEGVLAPAGPGTVGRGVGHRLSAQQAVGLAYVAALCDSERGCARAFAAKTLAHFEGMSDRLVERFLDDERVYERIGPKPNPAVFGDGEEFVADVKARLARVRALVRGSAAEWNGVASGFKAG